MTASILDSGFWIVDFGLEEQRKLNPNSKIENPKSR